jgi:hypothetical protein
VSHASLIGFAIWCHAASCPANAAGTFFGPAASANVYQADITIDEPDPPTVSATGSLWGHSGWISTTTSGWYVSFASSDPAGVCGFRAVITTTTGAWVQADDESVAPDPSQTIWRTPCPNRPGGATWTPNIAALADGYYDLWVQASNPAGLWTNAGGGPSVLAVDNTPPAIGVTSAPAVRWYDTPQQVAWAASDNLSGVQGVACSDGWHPGVASYTMTVGQQGVDSVSCNAADNAGNWGTAAGTTVYLDYQTPTATFDGPSQSAWLRGPQTITVNAGEQQSLSGIEGVSCSLNGATAVWNPGSQASVTATADGTNTIECSAATNAGTWSPMATYSVHVDSDPPTLSYANGPDQGRWYGSAQAIDVTAQDSPGLDQIALISCSISGQTTVYHGSHAHVTVQPPGGQLVCAAEDDAGNWSETQPWSFLIDTTPPTGYFAPRDLHDPALVVVDVADSGSGVAGGQIELQMASGWEELPTTYDPSAGQLSARIADDSSVPDGTYALRALVWDEVGNLATITADATGNTEEVAIPLRIVTQLRVGQADALIRYCTVTRVKPGTPARRANRQPPPVRFSRTCDDRVVPRSGGVLQLGYGQSGTVRGLLQSADGQPLADARVDVTQQAQGWSPHSAGSVRTDPHGRFSYRIPPGPSRTITFTFPATNTLRGAAAGTAVLVEDNATITASPVARAGQKLQLSGRLLGGYVPAGGTLIQLQYKVLGYPEGWAPFDVLVRTRRDGSWSMTVTLPAAAAGFTYLMRGVVAPQNGWPWAGAVSNVVVRHVVG